MTVPMTPRVYMASAGTGKTFQLTNRALELLVRHVPHESILATTFTRKAAGEIMERLLGRLVEAADKPDKLAELNELLPEAQFTRELCLSLLSDALRNVHRLGVQTLDAFFARLATLRGLELGLPPGWGIVDAGQRAVLSQAAMARVLADSGEEEMLELLRRLAREDMQRSAYGALEKVISQAYEIYRQSTPEAWEALPPLPGLSDSAIQSASESLAEAPLPTTAKGEPNKTWWKAREAGLLAANEGRWEDFLSTGLVKKVVEGEEVFSKKPIEGELLEAIQTLVGQASAEIIEGVRARGRIQRDLLERYHRAFEALKHERRLFEFNDLPYALAAGADNELTSESTALRMDGRIEHLLLDEFQDTSVLQGRVLRPLMEAVLGEEAGSFFCVGDVKQSIYGWRQGEPRLLQSLPDQHPRMESHTLDENFRSSEVVLDSVRQVFEGLGECSMFQGKPALREAAFAWMEGFQAPVAKRSLSGAVRLLEVDTGNEAALIDERRRAVLAQTVEHVAQLVVEAPGASIGVLVRRKASMPAIIYGLMEKGVAASGEGGNPLTDSDAVRIALSLLTLAEHPADSAAFFHVATSPLAECLETSFPADRKLAMERASALSWETRRALSERGFGPYLSNLQRQVKEHAAFDAWDTVRFGQLVDMGFAADERAGEQGPNGSGAEGPGAFVEQVWTERVEAPTEAAVKVMTIHGSKGLEFDAVVLPDLEGRLISNSPALLTQRPDPWQPMDLVAPSSKWNHLHPELKHLAAEAEGRALREELCVLYVAMTRAVHRLDMLIPREGKRSEPRSMATLLRETLREADESEAAAEPVRVLWQHPASKTQWAPPADAAARAAPKARDAARSEADTDSAEIRLVPASSPRWLPRQAPSSRSHGQAITTGRLLDLGDQSARVRGLLVHAWLSGVEWLEEHAATDDALRAEAWALGRQQGLELNEGMISKYLREFRQLLGRDVVSSLLTRGSRPEGSVEVWRERAFAVSLSLDGVSTLVRGAFDRVLLEREGERVVAAEIVDFKTDAVSTEDSGPLPEQAQAEVDQMPEGQLSLFGKAERAAPAGIAHALPHASERAEQYRPQMDAYREVLSHMTGLPLDAIRCRILFVAAGLAVDV